MGQCGRMNVPNVVEIWWTVGTWLGITSKNLMGCARTVIIGSNVSPSSRTGA
ncbi:MAG: hypothetical protein WC196_06005 [Bacilli bacterium]